jgi:hypothetical protein
MPLRSEREREFSRRSDVDLVSACLDRAEGDDRERVDGPRLLALRVDVGDAVDGALDRLEDTVTRRGAACVDACDVRAEHRGRRENERNEARKLEPRLPAHPRVSGASSA